MSEMIPATKNLGKKYASLSIDRGGSKKGDLFRLVSVEDNTTYEVHWYDLETKELINNFSGTLQTAGDFQEISPAMSVSAETKSITGTSVFEADKPFLLMQYSYSGSWDESSYDPFMFVVAPVEQYVTHTMVQTPSNKTYAENFLNIIVQHNSDTKDKSDLESLTINDQKISDLMPSFKTNQIPGTNLYWAKIKIKQGAYQIKGNGNVKFSAFIYGIKSVDCYGWTASFANKPINEIDTLAPVVTYDNKESNSGSWKIRIEENRTFYGDNINQVDSKVWFAPINYIDNQYGLSSINFKNPQLDFEWEFAPHDNYEITLEVEDLYEYAELNFFVADYVGNVTLDQIKYYPNLLELETEENLDFGKINITSTTDQILTFKNIADINYNIHSVTLSNGSKFNLLYDFEEQKILKGESIDIPIRYAPTVSSDKDTDTLRITTDNIVHTWILKGKAFEEKEVLTINKGGILDFGKVILGEKASEQLEITNDGNVDIDIVSIYLSDGNHFAVDNSLIGSVLKVGHSKTIIAYFEPKDTAGTKVDSLIIESSNAKYSCLFAGYADTDISVAEKDSKNIIKVSPNPVQATTNIQVELPYTSHITVVLYSAEGQFIKSLFEGICNKEDKFLEFDATNLASGTYTLVIELPNRQYSTQIIVSK